MPKYVYAGPLKMNPIATALPNLTPASYESYFDKVGIWLSGLCMIHCVLTPIALLLLPMMTFAKSEWIHIVLACILPLVAFAAFIPGYRRHGDRIVIGLGLMGLVFIIFAAVDPLHILNIVTEGMVTSCGSLSLISAHLRNRLLNRCDYPHHTHSHRSEHAHDYLDDCRLS